MYEQSCSEGPAQMRLTLGKELPPKHCCQWAWPWIACDQSRGSVLVMESLLKPPWAALPTGTEEMPFSDKCIFFWKLMATSSWASSWLPQEILDYRPSSPESAPHSGHVECLDSPLILTEGFWKCKGGEFRNFLIFAMAFREWARHSLWTQVLKTIQFI